MSRRKSDTARGGFLNQETKSASLAEAERTIQFLEAENKELREELADTKSLYIQLTKENRHEKFEERRVILLKAQLIQLERQLLLLNDALGARMSVVLEAENALQDIADRCRGCKNQEARIGGFFISNEDLNRLIETAESARLKLYKNIENTSMQRLHKPVQFLDKFVKQSERKKYTLLDVCSGELEHLNLKQVGKLESKLSQVYGQLQKVNHGLTVHLFPDDVDSGRGGRDIVPQASYVKMLGECSKACNMLNEVLPDLLELSVLVPSAPWPALVKPVVREMTAENVMERMPVMSKVKAEEAAGTVTAVLKVLSLVQLKAAIQEKTYREELEFHKSVHDLQLEYIDNLFKALRVAYEQFESDTNELICTPLEKVLVIYQSLKKTAAEEALRLFLATFKEYEPQLASAVAKLKKEESFKGKDEALSSHAKDFFYKLEEIQVKCQEKRDVNIDELQEVKDKQKEYWAEIRKFMQDDLADVKDGDTSRSVAGRGKRKGPRERAFTPDKSWDFSVDITRNDSVLGEEEFGEEPAQPRTESFGHLSSSRKDKNVMKNQRRNKAGDVSDSVQSPTSASANVQEESEALFKSLLRGGVDDGPGFVFDTEPHPCGSEKESNGAYANTGGREGRRSKPPVGKSTGRLMKGVAQSKLVLKPIAVQKGVRSRSATPEMKHSVSDNTIADDATRDVFPVTGSDLARTEDIQPKFNSLPRQRTFQRK